MCTEKIMLNLFTILVQLNKEDTVIKNYGEWICQSTTMHTNNNNNNKSSVTLRLIHISSIVQISINIVHNTQFCLLKDPWKRSSNIFNFFVRKWTANRSQTIMVIIWLHPILYFCMCQGEGEVEAWTCIGGLMTAETNA